MHNDCQLSCLTNTNALFAMSTIFQKPQNTTDFNSLTGSIPTEFGFLTSLTYFDSSK